MLLRFEDLQVDYKESKLCLSNSKHGKDEIDLRLHAFAAKDESSSPREAQLARFAIRSTKDRQWLHDGELSRVAAGEVDGSVYSKAFSYQLELFMEPESSWSIVCYMMSQVEEIGYGDGDRVEVWGHYVCQFLKVAARLGAEMGCRSMPVVVEFSL